MGMFAKYNKGETTGGMFAKYNPSSKASTPDVRTLEGLKEFAASKGVETPEKETSFFRKALDVVSRPLYASAGFAKALVKKDEFGDRVENPLEEAWKGLSGQDKETYSDVLREVGVENKWIRGGVGFALDVALDPATYFAGGLIKGVGKGIGTVGKISWSGARKVNPKSIASLEVVGKSLKDAFGHAFNINYGLTKKEGYTIADDVARYFNKLGMAKEDMIKVNFKAFNKFDDDTLRKATDIMFHNKKVEKGLISGKFIKGTGKTSEAVNEMKKLGTKIGKLTDLPKPLENYIPSILKERKIAAPVGLKVSKKGYEKSYMNKIADDDLLKKPTELYSRRQYEVVKDNLTLETLKESIVSWGKSVKAYDKLDDVEKALFKPVYEKGTAGLKLIKAGEGLPKFAGFKKPLGYLKTDDFEYVNNYMFPEMKTIDMLAKATKYDTFTNWWKAAVTAWFPAFHARNYISGNVQNYSILGAEAFNPINHMNGLGIIKGTNKILNFKHWSGSGDDMLKIMKENFRGASRYVSDLGNYIDDLGNGSFKIKSAVQKLNPRQLGNFIEMNQKAVAVSTALRKGKTLKQAIKLAEQAGFDYTKITKFENKILKRAIPFYTFARKNAELQVRTAIKNPERILNQIKFTNNLSEVFGGKPTVEDLKGLPEWALNGLGFKVEGNRYLTKFGLPLEEFVERVNRPFKTTLTSLNPMIKFPLENELGYDFFREEKIIDINKISSVSGELILKKAPDWFKDIMKVKKVETDYGTKYYASPKSLHVLRNIPTARFQKTLENMFENDKESVDKWLAFLTGARIYDIDIELQKYFNERDLRRDIEDQLLQIGEGKKYESFYIPKD